HSSRDGPVRKSELFGLANASRAFGHEAVCTVEGPPSDDSSSNTPPERNRPPVAVRVVHHERCLGMAARPRRSLQCEKLPRFREHMHSVRPGLVERSSEVPVEPQSRTNADGHVRWGEFSGRTEITEVKPWRRLGQIVWRCDAVAVDS